MAGWRHHDLQRTGRSLMSRLKISSDIAERVLDHAVGVRKTYDLHDYLDVKCDALEKLAALVGRIVDPGGGTVVPFAKERKTA
jgi:hypothetical protein